MCASVCICIIKCVLLFVKVNIKFNDSSLLEKRFFKFFLDFSGYLKISQIQTYFLYCLYFMAITMFHCDYISWKRTCFVFLIKQFDSWCLYFMVNHDIFSDFYLTWSTLCFLMFIFHGLTIIFLIFIFLGCNYASL